MGGQEEREAIVEELASLPAGTIVIKKINGREQPYLQWREGGKVRSRYLKAPEREAVVRALLEDRSFLREGRRARKLAAETILQDVGTHARRHRAVRNRLRAPLLEGGVQAGVRGRRVRYGGLRRRDRHMRRLRGEAYDGEASRPEAFSPRSRLQVSMRRRGRTHPQERRVVSGRPMRRRRLSYENVADYLLGLA